MESVLSDRPPPGASLGGSSRSHRSGLRVAAIASMLDLSPEVGGKARQPAQTTSPRRGRGGTTTNNTGEPTGA